MPAAKKVKVRFLETCKVQDAEGRIFEKGKTYELTEDSAWHWFKRNKAEPAANKSDSKPKEPKPAGDEPDAK